VRIIVRQSTTSWRPKRGFLGLPRAAQQGVAGYLRAHGAEATLPDMELPWDPAVRAVLAYLHGYGW